MNTNRTVIIEQVRVEDLTQEHLGHFFSFGRIASFDGQILIGLSIAYQERTGRKAWKRVVETTKRREIRGVGVKVWAQRFETEAECERRVAAQRASLGVA